MFSFHFRQDVGDIDDNQDDHLNRRLVVLRPIVAKRDAKITPPENDIAPRHVLQLEARFKVDSHSAGEDGNAQHDFTSGFKHVYYHDSVRHIQRYNQGNQLTFASPDAQRR